MWFVIRYVLDYRYIKFYLYSDVFLLLAENLKVIMWQQVMEIKCLQKWTIPFCMWSCKFVIELKYLIDSIIKDKKNWLILYITSFFSVHTCILIPRAKNLQVQMLQKGSSTSVWSFVLIVFFMTCETISQWNCIFVYTYFHILFHLC